MWASNLQLKQDRDWKTSILLVAFSNFKLKVLEYVCTQESLGFTPGLLYTKIKKILNWLNEFLRFENLKEIGFKSPTVLGYSGADLQKAMLHMHCSSFPLPSLEIYYYVQKIGGLTGFFFLQLSCTECSFYVKFLIFGV